MVLRGKTPVTRITVITRTNGVSFSLVAGACCIVSFSNSPSQGKQAPTMNINSTGAKNWRKYVGDTGNWGSSSLTATLETNPTLLIYSGSEFYSPGTEIQTYDDSYNN